MTPTSTHRRLGPGLEEVEEQAQLALAAPQGDASRGTVDHRGRVTGAGEGETHARAGVTTLYGPQGQPPMNAAATTEASPTSASRRRGDTIDIRNTSSRSLSLASSPNA